LISFPNVVCEDTTIELFCEKTEAKNDRGFLVASPFAPQGRPDDDETASRAPDAHGRVSYLFTTLKNPRDCWYNSYVARTAELDARSRTLKHMIDPNNGFIERNKQERSIKLKMVGYFCNDYSFS